MVLFTASLIAVDFFSKVAHHRSILIYAVLIGDWKADFDFSFMLAAVSLINDFDVSASADATGIRLRSLMLFIHVARSFGLYQFRGTAA